jgi:hypothetical protein
MISINKRFLFPLTGVIFTSFIGVFFSIYTTKFKSEENSLIAEDHKWIKRNLKTIIDIKNHDIEQLKNILINNQNEDLNKKLLEYIQERVYYTKKLKNRIELDLKSELKSIDRLKDVWKK